MSGIYASDGSMNVTVVDGTTYVGLYASNGGSVNVIKRTSEIGRQHSSGALLVTPITSNGNGIQTSDGSLNVSESPYYNASQKVTVVSGSFSPGGPPVVGNPMGLLLTLTYSS